ncbi:MAG: hypothetical protein QOK31_1700 [Solirubrobacteraceae bacterium]|nr:hypothetical protein [Solirubrobacteraceae bacterium]
MTDYTWSGATPAGTDASNWTNTTNWVGGTAPSGSVGTLNFPSLAGNSACTTDPPTATCYESHNDVAGISANALSIDDGAGYIIDGNAITLGAGGLTATTSSASSSFNGTVLDLPITLGADQTWTVDAGSTGTGGLSVKTVTGAHTLAINFNSTNGGSLSFNGDSEVGALTLHAADSFTGINLEGKLNATDGSPVNLNTAGLFATGGSNATGPLTATNGWIQVGQGTTPDGTLAVNGAVTLDSSTLLALHINQPGTSPGADYSQLTATGAVNLGGANLKVHWGDQPACTPLHVGDVYTLIQTTGALTGTFHDDGNQNVPDGSVVELINHCIVGTAPTVRIHYTSNSVTATVVTAGSTGSQPSPPGNTGLPKITGRSLPGKTLTCANGTWSGNPFSYSYRWNRNGAAITGATSSHYIVKAGDAGRTLTCTVTALNSDGSSSATSRGVKVPQCVVPRVVGKTLSKAKSLIRRAHCAVGRVTHKRSSGKAGRVLKQKPRAGHRGPPGTKVALVVSKKH